MSTYFPIVISFGAGIAFVTLALGISLGNNELYSSPALLPPQQDSIAEKVVEVTISESASLESSGRNFEPRIITVIVGINNTVRWINEDVVPSSVVADDNSDTGFFNATQSSTGNPTEQSFLLPGETFEYTFAKGGVFGYYSVPHPHMRGTVIVQQSTPEDAATRVAENRKLMAEAQSLFSKSSEEQEKIFAYQKEKESTTDELLIQELDNKIQASSAEIESIEKHLRELEELNIRLYQVEPELESRIYAAEKLLLDRYVDSSSRSYVGDNPVDFVLPDLLTRSIVILVNTDKVAPDGSNIPRESEVDGFPVTIEFVRIELI